MVIQTTDIMNYRTWKAEKALQDHLEKQHCMHTHTQRLEEFQDHIAVPAKLGLELEILQNPNLCSALDTTSTGNNSTLFPWK